MERCRLSLSNSKAYISRQVIPLYLLGSDSNLMAEKTQQDRLDSLSGKLPHKAGRASGPSNL